MSEPVKGFSGLVTLASGYQHDHSGCPPIDKSTNTQPDVSAKEKSELTPNQSQTESRIPENKVLKSDSSSEQESVSATEKASNTPPASGQATADNSKLTQSNLPIGATQDNSDKGLLNVSLASIDDNTLAHGAPNDSSRMEESNQLPTQAEVLQETCSIEAATDMDISNPEERKATPSSTSKTTDPIAVSQLSQKINNGLNHSTVPLPEADTLSHNNRCTRPSPKGIGGALYVFCFILVMVSPFAFLIGSDHLWQIFSASSTEYYKRFFDISAFLTKAQILLSIFTVLSCFTGYALYFGCKCGRGIAFFYLMGCLGLLAWLIHPSVGNISLEVYNQIYLSHAMYLNIYFAWILFWLFYFLFSKRVRNNYGCEYSSQIREIPLRTSSYVILPIWIIFLMALQIPAILNILSFQHIDHPYKWPFLLENIGIRQIETHHIDSQSIKDIAATTVKPSPTPSTDPKLRDSVQDVSLEMGAPGTKAENLEEPDDNYSHKAITHQVTIGSTSFIIPEPLNVIMQSVNEGKDKRYRIKLGFTYKNDIHGYMIAYAFTTVNGTEDKNINEEIFESYRNRLIEGYQKTSNSLQILENRTRAITFSNTSDTVFMQKPAKRLTLESYAVLKGKLYRLLVNVIYYTDSTPPDAFELLLSWRIAIIRANLEGSEKMPKEPDSSYVIQLRKRVFQPNILR